MSGEEGESAEAARKLGTAIEEELGYKVTYWDERMSTMAADRALADLNIKAKDRKDKVDSTAAALILQGFLDSETYF